MKTPLTKTVTVPATTTYKFTEDTTNEAAKVPVGTLAQQAHFRGMASAEPLIVLMDALLKYARAYQERFDSKLASDYVLGDHWLASVKGVRALLNGDGAVAMQFGITTDSKDNGAVEAIFWRALEAAGFEEEDI